MNNHKPQIIRDGPVHDVRRVPVIPAACSRCFGSVPEDGSPVCSECQRVDACTPELRRCYQKGDEVIRVTGIYGPADGEYSVEWTTGARNGGGFLVLENTARHIWEYWAARGDIKPIERTK